jgi:hypothetical protein
VSILKCYFKLLNTLRLMPAPLLPHVESHRRAARGETAKLVNALTRNTALLRQALAGLRMN